MNEYFLWFRQIISLNILCWCPLVWLPGPLGIFGVASVSYFPVMILYNSIMSPLILRYANVGRPSLVSLSLYSRSRKPGISLVALRCTFLILVICFFRNGAHILGVVSLMLEKGTETSFLKVFKSAANHAHGGICFFNFFSHIWASNERFESIATDFSSIACCGPIVYVKSSIVDVQSSFVYI